MGGRGTLFHRDPHSGRVERVGNYGSGHNDSIDEIPPPGYGRGDLSKSPPEKSQPGKLVIVPPGQSLNLHKPKDVGVPSWQENEK